MKHTKRLLALALVLCMAISMMVLSAFAISPEPTIWPTMPGHVDFRCVRQLGDNRETGMHIYVVDVLGKPNMANPSQNKIRSFVTVDPAVSYAWQIRLYDPCPYCPDAVYSPDVPEGHCMLNHNHSFQTVSNEAESADIQQQFIDPVVPGMWYEFREMAGGYKVCNNIHTGRGWNDVAATVDFVNNGDCDFDIGSCNYYPTPTYWPEDYDPFGTPTTTPAPKKQPKTGVADALPLWVSFMSASAGAYVLTSKKKRS